MKNFYLTLVAIFVTSLVFGQTAWSWKDGIKDVNETFHFNSYYSPEVRMINQTGGSLTLEWQVLNNTLPAAWDVLLCDYTACYFSVPSGGTMTPISGSTEGFLRFTINAMGVTGTGNVTFLVYDANNPSDADTATFNLTADDLTGISNLSSIDVIQTFPNPVTDGSVTVQNTSAEAGNLQLIDVSGKMVSTIRVNANATQIMSVVDFPTGIYFIVGHIGSSAIHQKLVIK